MRPVFRNDLVCSREEQQGVVFYRIDDPETQTSFRLYEIEFLIAKKLDGSLSFEQVIDAVKKEFNFDITLSDLDRFVGQLESMGFLVSPTKAKTQEQETTKTTTQVMPKPRQTASDLEMIEPITMPDSESSAKVADFERHLRSALLQVKQGYIVHARDYFLAARDLQPTDERLRKIVNHLEIIGDASGPAEVEYLWNQARELFPEYVDDLSDVVEPRAPAIRHDLTPPMGTDTAVQHDDLRARIVWSVVAILVIGLGLGALVWVVKVAKIFETSAKVRVATLTAEKIPIFYSSPASQVVPLKETWLQSPSNGQVTDVAVNTGSRVNQGDILVTLNLAPAVQTQLDAIRKSLKTVSDNGKKIDEKLEKLASEREAIEAERTAAEDRLRQLTPKGILGKGGVSKRDLEKWKRVKVGANKKLTALAKRERGPRQLKQKNEDKRQTLQKKLEDIEKKIANKLIRAPFAGTIHDIKTEVGATLTDKQQVLLLRDAQSVKLVFSLGASSDLQNGGECFVSVARGSPSRAKITNVQKDNSDVKVDISLTDPTSGFAQLSPKEFRLVKEFAEPAFRVPASAVVQDEKGTRVFMALQRRALERDVDVLEQDATSAVIRDTAGTLRQGEQIVVNRIGEPSNVSSIVDGVFLEIIN